MASIPARKCFRRLQALDAFLDDRLAGISTHLKASKRAEGNGIFQVKGQFLIGQFAILLENGATQHLVGRKTAAASFLAPALEQIAVNGMEDIRCPIQNLRNAAPLLGNGAGTHEFEDGHLPIDFSPHESSRPH